MGCAVSVRHGRTAVRSRTTVIPVAMMPSGVANTGLNINQSFDYSFLSKTDRKLQILSFKLVCRRCHRDQTACETTALQTSQNDNTGASNTCINLNPQLLHL
jgi:hypothetical protein